MSQDGSAHGSAGMDDQAAVQASPQPQGLRDARGRITLILASLGFFLITLDVSIVNLSLPSISADLDGRTSALQWILDGYTILFAVLLLCAGNLSDRWGARTAYIWGIALFGAASLACAAAPTMGVLVAARCVQGMTAALMLPASMSLIREAFPDARERSTALGVWAAGGAVASAAGPLLGGFLSGWDWRLIFAINVPLCLIMLVLCRQVQPSSRAAEPFDWAGQILIFLGLGSVIFVMIEGAHLGYGSPFMLILAAVGIAALALFLIVQARSAHPMMPLGLFRSGPMRIAMFGGFTFIFSWFGTVFVVSLFLQQELQMAPGTAGLLFLPGPVLAFFGNLVSGLLANRFGPRMPVALGMGSLVVGMGLLAATAPLGSAVLVSVLVAAIGTGGSVAMPPLAGVVLEHAPEGQAGVASAVQNTFRQIGGALAVALFGVLVAGQAGFLPGMQISLAIGAGLALLCLVMSLILRRGAAHGPEAQRG